MLVDDEHLKIIDFGLARKLTDNVECREMLGTPEFVGNVTLSLCLPICLSQTRLSVFKKVKGLYSSS